MRYQLVLQFRGESLADFDTMVALEEDLITELGNSAEVDGHDCGSGETNIFILTSDPVATFEQARRTLQKADRLTSVRVAYRPLDGNEYRVIWPTGSRGEFKVT